MCSCHQPWLAACQCKHPVSHTQTARVHCPTTGTAKQGQQERTALSSSCDNNSRCPHPYPMRLCLLGRKECAGCVFSARGSGCTQQLLQECWSESHTAHANHLVVCVTPHRCFYPDNRVVAPQHQTPTELHSQLASQPASPLCPSCEQHTADSMHHNKSPLRTQPAQQTSPAAPSASATTATAQLRAHPVHCRQRHHQTQ